jgi:hypothetical protein
MDDRPEDGEQAGSRRRLSLPTPASSHDLPTASDDLDSIDEAGAPDDLVAFVLRDAPDDLNALDHLDYLGVPDDLSPLDGETYVLAEGNLTESLDWDIALRHELAYDMFHGPNWNKVAGRLVEYGLAVIKSWLQTRKMWKQCKENRCWPGAPPDVLSEDDCAELANETVARAINTFQDKAMTRGGWRPERGASLSTYFIGRCVFAFPNVYRK